ncbi:CCA tRNA nucleotidyltransferase [Altererythrobacter xixiisoli]|uniref:CCA tRNA nucleotidyltransferase n=1 Tax=Croceibacterium xixiisoli TaxID=1476466 RepID=A0A6I4TTR2_9SPHN|nr:CCA tRNA nucleotidyltransferase [Croceibacterium xixiisoli]MXO99386.1 CCA tRNA nucleotidyltransferase [Croceibacterium xixiisoli]
MNTDTNPPHLPAAEWTRRADLARLVATLGPGNLRWVGGAVRDTLLDHPVKDIDAATPLEPEVVMQALKNAGISCIPTGIAHGTVTAVLAGGPVEITTLRHDVSTDGRRATVAFATAWEDDAARRDFTINALYCDPDTLELHDYFYGRADLAEHRVRFIGDARQRIREDHLRILRYYRFQARFGATLDAEAEAACAELAPTLKGLSRERVGSELLNLLSLNDPSATVARMFAAGVLPVILPETTATQVAALAALCGEEARQQVAPDAVRRLAALVPADAKVAEQVAARLRLSAAQKKRLATAAARPACAWTRAEDVRVLAYRQGKEAAIDQVLLAGQSIAPLIGWDVPAFPLKGGDIVRRGVGAGPEVARILRQVEEKWLAEGFPGQDRVMQILEATLPA